MTLHTTQRPVQGSSAGSSTVVVNAGDPVHVVLSCLPSPSNSQAASSASPVSSPHSTSAAHPPAAASSSSPSSSVVLPEASQGNSSGGGFGGTRTVSWTAETIDNENCGKKKSKKCCIFHKQRSFGESSSDSSSSDSDSSPSDSDSEAAAAQQRHCSHGGPTSATGHRQKKQEKKRGSHSEKST